MLKPDLHCHSHFSDGQHSPQELLLRASANQLTHLAITDHDCLTESAELDIPAGLTLVPGLEISCNWNKHEIHIVGLCIDSADAELMRFVSRQQQARKERVARISEKLQKQGITGLEQFLQPKPCLSWTRSHIAEFLVADGHSKSFQKAFKQYLKHNASAYVAADWPGLAETIAVIREARGIAVLAHPTRYSLTNTRLNKLVDEFIASGGEAIEVSYGGIDPLNVRKLCNMALEKKLYVSAGSDFHSADRQWTDLGKFPSIESQAIKNAIWNHSRWHFS